MHSPQSILKKYWGYDSFRPLQEEIIASVLDGHDTVGLLPTGGGKSITFQVPGLALGGLTIVITPLISLMKDQADHLADSGIKAAAVYMGMTREEILETYERVIRENYHFLYLSPERIHTQLFQNQLRYMDVRLLVVDEAHCISQWGYDFRPSYLQIAELRTLLHQLRPERKVCCMALTATATPEVVGDIQRHLRFGKDARLFQATFERPNLTYKVIHTEDKLSSCIRLLHQLEGSAIIYVRSRKRTAEIAEALTQEGITATYYHAGLKTQDKEARQNAWIAGEVPVIVATNAFGMGIDKPDVRIVIHIDLPPSPEEYYQEAGRAGRDQKPAVAWLLVEEGDKSRLINNLNDTYPDREYVRMVYDRLAFFFSIPIGEGYNHMYEFDIYRYCSAYRLQANAVYYSIKLLDKAGYIAFQEDPESRSRLMFTCSREHLYHIQQFDNECQRIINALLRLYTGLFADFQRISEERLMAFTQLDHETLYQKLLLLSRFHILHYIPARQMPAILYLTNRRDHDEIRIDHSIYEDRKEQQMKRIRGMIDYVDNNEECRLVQLLRYFGEHLDHNCGKCDVCRAKSEQLNGNPEEEKAFIEQQIVSQLSQSPSLTLPQLLDRLHVVPTDKVTAQLRRLVDQGKLILKQDRISLSE